MTKSKELLSIGKITNAIYSAERAKLMALSRRAEDLIAQLAGLRAAKGASAFSYDTMESAAVAAGADMLWHRWIDQRREVLNRELAQVLALKAAQQDRVKVAFGRQQAVENLSARDLSAQMQQARRRTDYIS